MFEELFGFIECEMNGIPLRGDIIGTDTVNNGTYSFTVDTCFVNDVEAYETAVKANDEDWIVVERYNSPEEAKAGHEKWMLQCRRPQPMFHSIQDKNFYIYT